MKLQNRNNEAEIGLMSNVMRYDFEYLETVMYMLSSVAK